MIQLILMIISLPTGSDKKLEQCVTLAYNNNSYVTTIEGTKYYGKDFFSLVCDKKETIKYAKAYKY